MSAARADNTAGKQLVPYRWQKGQSGNPRGRPKGSRNKFSKRFFEDVHAVWEEGGLEILKAAVVKNPVAFARIMATLVPRDFDIEPPKRSVGFKAIWEKMGRGAVPPMTSPPGVDDP